LRAAAHAEEGHLVCVVLRPRCVCGIGGARLRGLMRRSVRCRFVFWLRAMMSIVACRRSGPDVGFGDFGSLGRSGGRAGDWTDVVWRDECLPFQTGRSILFDTAHSKRTVALQRYFDMFAGSVAWVHNEPQIITPTCTCPLSRWRLQSRK
jgi:hypothetical protein